MTTLQDISNQDERAIVDWMMEKKLLPVSKACWTPKCVAVGKKLTLYNRDEVVDQWAWRCSVCSRKCSLKRDTIWEKNKISFRLILKSIFYWGLQTTQADQAELLGVSRTRW